MSAIVHTVIKVGTHHGDDWIGEYVACSCSGYDPDLHLNPRDEHRIRIGEYAAHVERALLDSSRSVASAATRMRCGGCGSQALRWSSGPVASGGIAHGQMIASDVESALVLGCEECSDDVLVVSAGEFAELLNVALLDEARPRVLDPDGVKRLALAREGRERLSQQEFLAWALVHAETLLGALEDSAARATSDARKDR